MFSIHLNKTDIDQEYKYAANFKAIDVDDPVKIGQLVKTFVNSAIVWHGGKRSKETFKAANWIGLDFDTSPLSLRSAIAEFSVYTHVIGTTRHHQLPKKDDGPRDRYRVFLQLPAAIDNCAEYESIVRYYMQLYKSDRAATDGARKFMPCREIVSVGTGRFLPPIREERRVYAPSPEMGFPRWVKQLLLLGPGYGESRNYTCYKIAKVLKPLGFTEASVVDMLMSSAIPIGPEVRREVVDAVRSGFKSI